MLLGIAALACQSFLIHDQNLDALAAQVREKAKAAFKSVADDQLAICVGKIDRAKMQVQWGHVQGQQPFYPASTVKLFYLAYAATLLQQKKIKITDEFQRGVDDMIVDSSNDATALVLDTITGTTGGPELSPSEFKKWQEKRNAVNRWAPSLGIEGVNVNQKTWNEGPYGRERQSLGPKYENRNSLTAKSGLQLMAAIALDRIANEEWTKWLQTPLLRKIPADGKESDYQSNAFTGQVLPKGARLYSKAGYTDSVRHDIAWVVLSNGREYIFSIFTRGQSKALKLIPTVARELLIGLGEEAGQVAN